MIYLYLYLSQPKFSTLLTLFHPYQYRAHTHTVAFYRASNNEIEASFIEHFFEEDFVLLVLSPPA